MFEPIQVARIKGPSTMKNSCQEISLAGRCMPGSSQGGVCAAHLQNLRAPRLRQGPNIADRLVLSLCLFFGAWHVQDHATG